MLCGIHVWPVVEARHTVHDAEDDVHDIVRFRDNGDRYVLDKRPAEFVGGVGKQHLCMQVEDELRLSDKNGVGAATTGLEKGMEGGGREGLVLRLRRDRVTWRLLCGEMKESQAYSNRGDTYGHPCWGSADSNGGRGGFHEPGTVRAGSSIDVPMRRMPMF